MKLSMWILADRLKDHIARYDIGEGPAQITGIRFFTEDLPALLPEYVYVGKGSDVFSDEAYADQVLLVHGYDLLFIEHKSVEGVLNDVLSIFDYYNAWESSLWAAAAVTENAIQRMVDASDGVMAGPIAIADAQGHVVAATQTDGPQMQDAGWRYVYENRIVPNNYTSARIRDAKGNLLNDWAAYPQIYDMERFICIGSQIVIGGESAAAFYMQEFDKKLTAGDVQLAEVFCGVLFSVVAMQSPGAEIKTISSIVSGLLNGEHPDDRVLTRLQDYIQDAPPYQLVLIESVTASTNIIRKNSLLETIKMLGVRTVTLVHGEDIISIIPQSALDVFLNALCACMNTAHYARGVSLPFDSFLQSRARYRQAQIAINLSVGLAGVFYFRDCLLEYSLSELRKLNHELELIHPALKTLRAYDRKNDNELYQTLRIYLENERNMVKTAEQLCVHRNTMKYRMHRIAALIDADLNDPRERLYILLSFYL